MFEFAGQRVAGGVERIVLEPDEQVPAEKRLNLFFEALGHGAAHRTAEVTVNNDAKGVGQVLGTGALGVVFAQGDRCLRSGLPFDEEGPAVGGKLLVGIDVALEHVISDFQLAGDFHMGLHLVEAEEHESAANDRDQRKLPGGMRRQRRFRRTDCGVNLARPHEYSTDGDDCVERMRYDTPGTPLVELGEHDVKEHHRRDDAHDDKEHGENVQPAARSGRTADADEPDRENSIVNQSEKRHRYVGAGRGFVWVLWRPIAPGTLQNGGAVCSSGFSLIRATGGEPRGALGLADVFAQQVVTDVGGEQCGQYRDDLGIAEFHE